MRVPSAAFGVRDRSVTVSIPLFVVPLSTRRSSAVAASAESFDELPFLVAPQGLALTVLPFPFPYNRFTVLLSITKIL
jgi:hypothetical protein